MLQDAAVRLTHQRIAVANLLFDGTHKHVCTEDVIAGLHDSDAEVSPATVYNILRLFEDAGLVRRIIGVGTQRRWFDTDTSAHPHFYVEDEDRVFDAPRAVKIGAVSAVLPRNTKSTGVDVVFRIRRYLPD
jgi:Fur family iron response transcriptional regulator